MPEIDSNWRGNDTPVRDNGRPSSNPVVVLIEADDEATDLIGDDNGVNDSTSSPPQSSAPQSPEQVEKDESVQVDSVSRHTSLSNQTSFAKGRKRRRNVARVADDAQNRPLLPPNQYETMLRRRAVCKPHEEQEDVSPTSSVRSIFTKSRDEQDDDDDSDNDAMEGDEEYGDISVGMKLNIIGGKVIVQRINALADGRASPAQLTGLIQRGDVLLSIDNVSLVNLPLDQLLNGLKPLSAPHHGNHYKRSLHLRFAAGGGLKLLEKNESKKPSADPTFALSQYVTFVDQLSGVPMFEPEIIPTEPEKPKEEPVPAIPVKAITPSTSLSQSGMSSDDLISVDIADFRKFEQQKYISEYFMGNDEFSEILRASPMLLSHEFVDGQTPLTFSEMMENGERAMGCAKALFLNMENVDKGNDTRSFKKWNSTLSLRSRANARRRYVMKNVIQHEEPVEEEPSDLESSVGSSTSGDADEPTGDELLLQLAAHDEIWRHNVIEVLQNAAKELAEGESVKQIGSDESHDNDPASSTNGAPQSLESLLFGSKVSTMLKSKKQSHALPPEDVTSVLFDLMTNLTVTPDEISLNGSNHHIRRKNSALVPFHERHTRDNTDTMYAAQFLISDALPVWLKSFRPLPWDQRSILWPKIASGPGTSLASASYDISNDDLTQDSGSTGYKSPGRSYRKGLRQQIEDLELNAETRAETCFLVTFYFTQELLPSIAVPNAEGDKASVKPNDAVEFVKSYGAYLNLHLSLVSSAAFKADSVIEKLLALAKFDPRHQEVKKQLSKSNSLVLYDPTMLSAIISRLQGVRKESKSDRRNDMMNICVLAYPDLLPWQVRQACVGSDMAAADSSEYCDMYYEYLSLLLHPWEGHDAARRDVDLVTEWCRLSLESLARSKDVDSQSGETERRKNFLTVASRSSSEHKFYRRDLFSLMNLSVKCEEYGLALDLADEMLDSPTYYNDKESLSASLDIMRQIAKGALNLEGSFDGDMDDVLLRKIFGLFEKMASSKAAVCRDSIDVSNELYSLLQSCQNDDPGASEAELAFVNLLAHHAAPKYALQTLALWAPDYSSEYVIPLLHILLQRGTRHGITSEISGSLLRIRYARGQSQGRQDVKSTPPADSDRNIWRRMFDGSVEITK